MKAPSTASTESAARVYFQLHGQLTKTELLLKNLVTFKLAVAQRHVGVREGSMVG